MKITESKETVNVENVKPMEPQIVRILDSKGMQVAFVCIGYKATSINIGISKNKLRLRRVWSPICPPICLGLYQLDRG